MLHTVYSDKLEILKDICAELISENPLEPLESELMVVQTSGMKHWFSLRFAERELISSGMDFVSPGELVQRLFRMGKISSPFDRDNLIFGIMEELGSDILDDPDFSNVKNYVENNNIRFFQLASRVADFFDQYSMYRIDMLKKWDNNKLAYGNSEHEVWQQKLWRRLRMRFKGVPSRYDAFLKLLSMVKKNSSELFLPPRISVFGITMLPPFFIELLSALSSMTDVFLYIISPSGEYWLDESGRKKGLQTDIFETYSGFGNYLLDSMGKVSRDFHKLLLHDSQRTHTVEKKIFSGKNKDTLLSDLQKNIVNYREHPEPCEKRADGTLQISIHYSPLREVEALSDTILAWLEEDPSLEPKDILVMTPDIDKYTPYIKAVFDNLPAEHRIPYGLADRKISLAYGLTHAFSDLMNLLQEKYQAGPLLAFLNYEGVYSNYDLSAEDMEKIRIWVDKTGIRWGYDGKFREEVGYDNTDINTWKSGLEQLILGCTVSKESLCFGTIPYTDVEGQDMVAVGALAQFIDDIRKAVEFNSSPHTLYEWSDFLSELLETFFRETPDNRKEMSILRTAVRSVAVAADTLNTDRLFSGTIIKKFMLEKLSGDYTKNAFMRGGITFASMVPLRSVPFRATVLLGMNEGDFPRSGSNFVFDLMKEHPRKGDRDIRENDRFLFLETLLSAEEKIHISYVGKDVKKNTDLLPSSLVLDLVEFLDTQYRCGKNSLTEQIIQKHPLHSFSPLYFRKNSELFSFRYENMPRSPVNFMKKHLQKHLDTEEQKNITLQELCYFFKNPLRYFTRETLGVSIPEEREPVKNSENFHPDQLDKYIISSILAENPDNGRELIKLRGLVPPGKAGQLIFDEISAKLTNYIKFISCFDKEHQIITIPEIKTGKFILKSDEISVRGQSLIIPRPTKIKPRDLMAAWIHQLFLKVAALPYKTVIIGTDKCLSFKDLQRNQAEDQLLILCNVFLNGKKTPLPVFERASFKYIKGKRYQKEYYSSFKNSGDYVYSDFIPLFFPQELFSDPSYSDIVEKFKEYSDKIYRIMYDSIMEIDI